jgi:hypothetical protein
MAKVILGAALGECIHVAGLLNFLQLAGKAGFETVFLGPAVPLDKLIEKIKETQPEIVALSYRLSPEVCQRLLTELEHKVSSDPFLKSRRYVFGGTVATARVARQMKLVEKAFDGSEQAEEIASFLGTPSSGRQEKKHAQTLLERMHAKHPFPLLRHHFGLPSLQETIEGSRQIAEAGVLDILSLAPDQPAQESFFKDDKVKGKSEGAGGAPFRKRSDFLAVYEATRRGNYPLLRCYSGTDDLLLWAEMLYETIKNAWCAVPLCWYNAMDRRSSRGFTQAFREAQQVMRWHAERGVPVEVNEAHQWSLRRAPDSVAVAMAFIAAYNAKKMGVREYVSQYMLNTPGEISPSMDLAKMLAKIEMIEGLHDASFKSYRQVRPGLLGFPADLHRAKGQMSVAILTGLMLKPHIVHVVAYCEGQYAATPTEIIESCKIAEQLIKEYRRGFPQNSLRDKNIQWRKEELKEEASALLEAIKSLGKGKEDPLVDAEVMETAVRIGLLDAPDLKGNEIARGEITTAIVDGACVAVDSRTGKPLPERERIQTIMARCSG